MLCEHRRLSWGLALLTCSQPPVQLESWGARSDLRPVTGRLGGAVLLLRECGQKRADAPACTLLGAVSEEAGFESREDVSLWFSLL